MSLHHLLFYLLKYFPLAHLIVNSVYTPTRRQCSVFLVTPAPSLPNLTSETVAVPRPARFLTSKVTLPEKSPWELVRGPVTTCPLTRVAAGGNVPSFCCPFALDSEHSCCPLPALSAVGYSVQLFSQQPGTESPLTPSTRP